MLLGCELAKIQAKGLEAVLDPAEAISEGFERTVAYQSLLVRYTQEMMDKSSLYRNF